MISLKSLRLRIVLVFTGFSLMLGTMLLVSILISTKYTEQYTLKKRLLSETERYMESLVSSPVAPVAVAYDVPIPHSPLLTSYIGEDLLPDWAQEEFNSLESGDYTRMNEQQTYYVSIRDLHDGQRFYLLFNVTTLLMDHEDTSIAREYFLITLLPTFVIGLLLGIITAYKVVSPVMKLSKIVREGEKAGKMQEDFSGDFPDDEIGFLARNLEHAYNEMQAALDREKAFARDASHELRTPVTTINVSLELLFRKLGRETKEAKLLARIQRATYSMEHLINSFLWLSRQEREHIEGNCNASEVIKEVVENQRYIKRNKPIDIVISEYFKPTLPVPAPLLTILIGNLLRNSLHYTQKGKVEISIYESCISVTDTGSGIPDHVIKNLSVQNGVSKADGFGFGLSIVHRICAHIGWLMNIDSIKGKGTRVTICCNTPGNSDSCPNICGYSHEIK